MADNAIFVSSTRADVHYKVLNQYGEDITSATSLQYATNGTGVTFANSIAQVAYGAVKVGDTVTLTLIHVDSAVTESKTLKVLEAAGAKTLKIESLYNVDGKTLNESSTPADFKLVIDAKDQYGNKLTHTQVMADVIASISDRTVVDLAGYNTTTNAVTFATTKINGVDRVTVNLANPLKAGSAKITLISKTTGTSTTFDVVVKDKVKSDTITLTPPEIVVLGEDSVFVVNALDVDGNLITKANDMTGTSVSVTAPDASTATISTFKVNPETKQLEVTVPSGNLGGSKGKLTLVAKTATNKVTTLQVDVKAAATPVAVVGFKSSSDVVPNLYLGAAVTFDTGDIIVEDNYGRTMSKAKIDAFLDATTYEIRIASNDASIAVTTGTLDSSVKADTLTAGAAKGSSTITLKLYDTTKTADVAGSAYNYDMRAVDKTQIVSYEVKDLGKMYDDADTAAAYQKSVTVYGILSNGTKVVVPAVNYTVISNVDPNKFIIAANVLDADKLITGDHADKTVTLTIIVNGDKETVQLKKEVVVSLDTPIVESYKVASAGDLTIKGNTVTGAFGDVTMAKLKALVEVTDQYGTKGSASAANDPVITVSNIASGSTVVVGSNGTKVATFSTPVASGDEFDITLSYGATSVTLKVIAE